MGILYGDFNFTGTMSVGTLSTSTSSILLVDGGLEVYGGVNFALSQLQDVEDYDGPSLNTGSYLGWSETYSYWEVLPPPFSTSGSSGTSGLSGTSGTSGSSGTSGTGFNTILDPGDFRILTSTNSSTHSAVAQTNLTFNPTTTQLGITGSILFDSNFTYSVAPTIQTAEIRWSAEDGTFDMGLLDGVVLQVGQESHFLIKNQSGSTIPRGQLVMSGGTLGNSGRILGVPAVTDGTYPDVYILGVATSDISDGDDGYVTNFGKVGNINTLAYPEGTTLYGDSTIPGGLTATEPQPPNVKATIAIVISQSSNGTIFVRPTFTGNLRDRNDVLTYDPNSINDGAYLGWSASGGLWEPKDAPVSTSGTSGLSGVNGVDGTSGTSGVSGIISNPGDYRILTASGSSTTEAVAWSGLTYDGDTLTVVGNSASSDVLNVQGTNGELFVVTDNLDGSLFSVNNISGLPVFEVFDTNPGTNLSSTIQFGDFVRRGYLATFDTTINTTTTLISLSYSIYNGVFVDYTLNSGTNSRAGNLTVVSDGTSSVILDSYNPGIGVGVEIGDTSDFIWTSTINTSNIEIAGSVSATYSIRAIIRSI